MKNTDPQNTDPRHYNQFNENNVSSKKNCRRVLLKISGEALAGCDKSYGHDKNALMQIAADIRAVYDLGVQVCVVVGGGNIYRGRDNLSLGIERATADYMGMLATGINALAIQSALEKYDLDTRIQSAVVISTICEPFIRRRAIRHMEKGRVVIFATGIGNPFFTTDSAAVLRAVEMNCDLLFKGTNVDGVFDTNPQLNSNAIKLSQVSYSQVLSDNLQIMDMAAIAVAKENSLPIKVFSIKKPGNFVRVLQGKGEFTLIT